MRTLIVILLLATGLSGCQSSKCKEAKDKTETLLAQVCLEDGYKDSPFCTCCVASGYYSVDDECTCRPLQFDTASCFYSTGDLATPQARQAVEYANSICAERKPALKWPTDTVNPACRAPDPSTASSTTTTSSASTTPATSSGGGGSGGTAAGGKGGAGGEG